MSSMDFSYRRIIFTIVLVSLGFTMVSCTQLQSPEQSFNLHGTSQFSIRKTFRVQSSGSVPDSLAPLYPNPFNHNTGDTAETIRFTLKDTGFVRILIQNPLGDSVAIFRDSLLPTGNYTGFWQPLRADGTRLRVGLYFITIRVAPDDPTRNYIDSRLLQIQSND